MPMVKIVVTGIELSYYIFLYAYIAKNFKKCLRFIYVRKYCLTSGCIAFKSNGFCSGECVIKTSYQTKTMLN